MSVGLSITLSQDTQVSNFICSRIVGTLPVANPGGSTLTLPVANPGGPDLPAQT